MIEIRQAILEDSTDIVRIGRDVFTTTFGHSVPGSELEAYLDSAYTEPLITSELKDATKKLIVAIHRYDSQDTRAVRAEAERSGDAIDRGVVVAFAQLTRGTSTEEPCVASLAHSTSSVELQRLYVDNSYHGQGIGSRLARAIEDIARREGFTHMWLGVWEENSVAARVYAKLGYSPIGFHDFAVGSIIQRDDILMKQL